MIKRGKFGFFAACSKYPDCKITLKLPKALIKNTGKLCEKCNYPIILVIRKGRRPQEICLNPECPTRNDEEQNKEAEKINSGEIKKVCPKCGSPMVVRSSFYGKFLACSSYPKCRYIEKIGNQAK